MLGVLGRLRIGSGDLREIRYLHVSNSGSYAYCDLDFVFGKCRSLLDTILLLSYAGRRNLLQCLAVRLVGQAIFRYHRSRDRRRELWRVLGFVAREPRSHPRWRSPPKKRSRILGIWSQLKRRSASLKPTPKVSYFPVPMLHQFLNFIDFFLFSISNLQKPYSPFSCSQISGLDTFSYCFWHIFTMILFGDSLRRDNDDNNDQNRIWRIHQNSSSHYSTFSSSSLNCLFLFLSICFFIHSVFDKNEDIIQYNVRYW